jgi:DNA-binding transcriptional ArsR family regulator
LSDSNRLDRRFRALADPTRRAIWEALGRTPGATTAELVSSQAGLSRWAIMKHLAVLRDAGLIQTLPQARHRRHYRDERALAPLRAWLGTGSEPPAG